MENKNNSNIEVQKADIFIKENMHKVNPRYRHKYHLMPPLNWCNDPNGLIDIDGVYHVFYQANPYQAVWGPMHWGHQISTDFIKWQLLPTALAPGKGYDHKFGAFSGSSLYEDGKLYLFYTATNKFQNQALAVSSDGVNFHKKKVLLFNGRNLPKGYSNADFRDPKAFKYKGKYYFICGNRNDLTQDKQIILFESFKITGPYQFKNVFYKQNNIGGITECPDLFFTKDKAVLLFSPQQLKNDVKYQFQNNDSCVYTIGTLTDDMCFHNETELQEFDYGFSFYASQIMPTNDGRNVLIAWMRSWAEENVTKDDHWCGSMVLPREVELRNQHLYQKPVREVYNYLSNIIKVPDLMLNNESKKLFTASVSRITVDIRLNEQKDGVIGLELFKNSTYATKLYYDYHEELLVLDRNNAGNKLDGIRYAKIDSKEILKLEIFLDVSSLEVFVNNGMFTMTAMICAPETATEVCAYATGQGTFMNITKADFNL